MWIFACKTQWKSGYHPSHVFVFSLRWSLWKHFYGVFVDDLKNSLSCKFIITCLSTVVSSLTADNSVDATLIWPGENKLHPVVLSREKWRDVVGTWSGVVFLSSQLCIISCCPQEKQILSRFGRMHGELHTYELRDWLWANVCSVISTQLMRYLGKSI